MLFQSLLWGHLVINYATVLLEGVGVEVVDIRHVVVEAVMDERKAQRAQSAEKNAVFVSMSAKNNIISLKSCSELSSTMIRELQNQCDRKRTLTTELANHIGSSGARKEAKERIAAYRLLKRSDDSDGDDDKNPYVGSHESLIVSIVECKTFISKYESQHRDQKKLSKSSLCDLTNKK